MPRVYNYAAILASFSEVSRLVREQRPVVLSKLEGLNSTSTTLFKEAVTHSFFYNKHGFKLDRIFTIDPTNPHIWHRVENTDNPKDDTLISLIMRAMSYVNREKRNRDITPHVVNSLTNISTDELIAELKRRFNTTSIQITL